MRFRVVERDVDPVTGVSTSAWRQVGLVCLDPGADPAAVVVPVVTPEMVLAEFRHLPLPSVVAGVQPAGRTVVNVETIVFVGSDTSEQVFDLVVLGQPVRLVASAESFVWSFGDGGSLGPTSERGGPYPSKALTHVYGEPASVGVSVAVTYSAVFSVGGGPEVVVPGTVTVQGVGTPLEVVEARSQLVAGD